ncbi:MAG: 1-(5-phosphoribosyl)-5-[(5-phosphoribosylamino)methylideneamino]imidazole-4-carboxamide isomerase [Candidatus Peregrinibacteria bacterium]
MISPFQLLPAIDLINGRPVRLLQGDYAQKTEYNRSFDELVEIFSSFGDGIHVVDLDGAKAGSPQNFEALERICSLSKIPVEFGGGVRTMDDIQKILSTGASRVILGTSALKNQNFLKEALQKFSADCLVVGADAKNGFIATHGWEETSKISVAEFLSTLQKVGIKTVIFTDISTDGTMAGPPLQRIEELTTNFSTLEIIASGGVSSLVDIKAIQQTGACGVVFGKAFYEGKLDVSDLISFSCSC